MSFSNFKQEKEMIIESLHTIKNEIKKLNKI